MSIKKLFSAELFFELSEHQDYIAPLLEKHTYVWDVLNELEAYIEFLFSEKKIKPNYSENVYVSPNAQVDSTARIIGPTVILDNSHVGFNAYLRKSVYMAQGSVIKHSTELKNCIILNNSHMSHFNYIGDSIVGNNVDIGLGAVTANYRLDKKPVKVRVSKEEKIQTTLRKFGAIIGDNTQIGANSVLNPGTVIGKGSIIFPLTSVLGVYSDNSTIK